MLNNSSAFGYVNGIPFINSITDAQQWATTLSSWEALTQSIFDSAVYPAAGTTQLTFFATPQGQGTGFGGGAKSASDTSMQIAGMLPANQAMLIVSAEIDFQPTTPRVTAQNPAVFGAQAVAAIVNDAYFFRTTGNLVLTIGQKPYLSEAPMMKFPASNDFQISAALADVSTTGASLQSRIAYGRADGPAYVLSPNNLLLTPNQNFGVTLNWPEGPQTITNPARVFVRFMGMFMRSAQ